MAASIEIKSDVHLERLLSTDPGMKAALEKAMGDVLWEARRQATERVKKYMLHSTHETHKAIRNTLYQKVLGGNINIYNVKRALRQGKVARSSRGRTKDTERILSYTGVDRGFIFRFINDSTNLRWTTNMDGHPMKRKSVDERPKSRKYKYPYMLGGRGGASKVRNTTVGMFEKEGDPVMQAAAQEFQSLIDKIIIERF